jgi:hypothetical protein
MVARSGAPGEDEPERSSFTPRESTRFGLYARRLWDGLLEHETVVSR